MFKIYAITIFLLSIEISTFSQANQKFNGGTETFSKTVINNAYNFQHPFDMFIGPDDSLWINEKPGLISKVNKTDGGRRIILDIRNQVTFTRTFTGPTVNGIKQDGILGMALHPDAMKGLGKDSLYLAYCYNGAAARKVKIVKFYCNPANNLLTNETILIQNLAGSDDHNGGKLVFGPDKKLYYSNGDQGANQFGNACIEIKSQKDITAAELSAGTYTNYAGHILRLNLDGSIPSDNPTFASVRSHVYSKGHRNPQGLVWEKDLTGAIPTSGAKLYESEQGAVTDDEINMVESGKNYGWPHIAGFNDDKFYTYKNWSLSPNGSGSVNCTNYNNVGECGTATNMTGANAPKAESSWPSPLQYTDPMKSQAATTTPDCVDYLARPTVAWSSIEHYNPNIGIPTWGNSLLLTTLKNSSVLRYKLNAAGTAMVADTIQYFRTTAAGWGINRYRDIAIGNDGVTLFVITDSLGATSGVTAGGGAGGSGGAVVNEGKLIAYKYTGVAVTLNLYNSPISNIRDREFDINVYPNPATDYLTINSKDNSYKPYTVKVYNNLGVLVVVETITNATQNVDVKKLINGIYQVVIYNRFDIRISTKKIVIQK
jgi:aldose sugar dehydrogenase